VLTAVEPLHYLDDESGQVGPLQHDLPARLAGHLSRAPMVSAAEAELFSWSLRELAPLVPLPCAPEELRIDDLPPVPHLSLGSQPYNLYDSRSGRILNGHKHHAGLAFLYQGSKVHGKVKDGQVRQIQDNRILSIQRQPKAEQALRKTLHQLGFKAGSRQTQARPLDAAEMFELDSEEAWLTFVQQQLPQLRAQGWQIEIAPGFQYDFSPVDGWYADLDEAPEHDWFDLELGILVEGRRISLLPVLLRLIQRNPELLSAASLQQRGDDELLRLQLDEQRSEDGRPLQVMLPFGRLKPVLATLGELYLRDQSPSAALRLSAPDAARLSELEGLPLEWQGGERLRAFARRLRDCQSVPTLAPRWPAG